MISNDAAMIAGTAMRKCSTFLYKVPSPPHDLGKAHVSRKAIGIAKGRTYDIVNGAVAILSSH